MAQSWQKVADRLAAAERKLAWPDTHPEMTPGARVNLQAIADFARNKLAEACRCFVCGKALTLPESKARGCGAACAAKLAARKELQVAA